MGHRNILQVELSTARYYMERLNQTIESFAKIDHLEELEIQSGEISNELASKWNKLFAYFETLEFENLSYYELKAKWATCFQILEGLVKLGKGHQKFEDIIDFINTSYKFSYILNKILRENSDFQVETPKSSLLKNTEDDMGHKRFFLAAQELLDHPFPEHAHIFSLEEQRDKAYQKYLLKGHLELGQKSLDQALEAFNKARSFRNCAEIINLIGWVYSQQGNIQKAKSYCLKSISEDPDYGPAYNDLGTYLLQEQQIDESLKWFELAKRSPVYQNREHPYINSGRAFLAKRDYLKALEEFSKALAMVPENEELQLTILKLRRTLEKSEFKDTSSQDEAPVF